MRGNDRQLAKEASSQWSKAFVIEVAVKNRGTYAIFIKWEYHNVRNFQNLSIDGEGI